MGLDISHDAFHGSYGAFNRFRQAVAKTIGGSFPPHEDKSLDEGHWYWPNQGYNAESHPGLHEFLAHSDCDGEITPQMALQIAIELEPLMPKMFKMGVGAGHIERDGGYAQVLCRFIKGCHRAAINNEPLVFG